MNLALNIVIGLVTGVFSGMLGIGGAVILIPALVLLLGIEQHTAQGVTLGVITATALAGSITHYRLHNVQLRVVLWIIPAAAAFAILGGWLAGKIEAPLLAKLFGVLLIVAGLRMALTR